MIGRGGSFLITGASSLLLCKELTGGPKSALRIPLDLVAIDFTGCLDIGSGKSDSLLELVMLEDCGSVLESENKEM